MGSQSVLHHALNIEDQEIQCDICYIESKKLHKTCSSHLETDQAVFKKEKSLSNDETSSMIAENVIEKWGEYL